MKIRVHATHGGVIEFAQNDTALEKEIITSLSPGRLFANKTLILGSERTCTVLQSAAISRIDFLTALPISLPEAPPQRQLIENTAALSNWATDGGFVQLTGASPGENYKGHMLFEMAGSHRMLVNLEGELASQPDLFSKLNHIYDLPFYALPHPQGGLVVVNMRNIVALTYLPGLKEYPKGYLPAERC